jgi:hypothetical protein
LGAVRAEAGDAANAHRTAASMKEARRDAIAVGEMGIERPSGDEIAKSSEVF